MVFSCSCRFTSTSPELYTYAISVVMIVGINAPTTTSPRMVAASVSLRSMPPAICATRRVPCLYPCQKVQYRKSVNGMMVSKKTRSEEHTSELQSRQYLVCRLLLDKKQNI